MRAGLVSLKKIKRLNAWKSLEEKTLSLQKQTASALDDHGLQMVTFGSLFWIHEKTDQAIRNNHKIPSGQATRFKKLFLKSLEKGLYLAPNAYEVGFMSMAHTDEVIQKTAQIMKESLNED